MVGVGTGPPNVLLAPKPTSSVRMSRIFGASLGALTSCGKSLVDSSTVRPMCPLKVCSGRGSTSCARAGSAKATVSAILTIARKFLLMFDALELCHVADQHHRECTSATATEMWRRPRQDVTIFGAVTLAFVRSQHARVAGLLRPCSF